jgi:hypothetical protein
MSSLLDENGAEIVRRAATTDLMGERKEFLFKFPTSLIQKQVVPMLQNSRDIPIVYLYSNICMLILPAALALFTYTPTSHSVGAMYFILNYVLFLQRFMLALHYSEHRMVFRPGKFNIKASLFRRSFIKTTSWSGNCSPPR